MCSRNLVTLISFSSKNWMMFMRWPFCVWLCVTFAFCCKNLVTEMSPLASWSFSLFSGCSYRYSSRNWMIVMFTLRLETSVLPG